MVKFALGLLSSNGPALLLAYCLSILSAKGTPVWFLHLISGQLNLTWKVVSNALCDLQLSGLISVDDKDEAVVVMHELVQTRVRSELGERFAATVGHAVVMAIYTKALSSSEERLHDILLRLLKCVKRTSDSTQRVLQSLPNSLATFQMIGLINSLMENDKRYLAASVSSYICLMSLQQCYRTLGDKAGELSTYERLGFLVTQLCDEASQAENTNYPSWFLDKLAIERYVVELHTINCNQAMHYMSTALRLIRKAVNQTWFIGVVNSVISHLRRRGCPKQVAYLFQRLKLSIYALLSEFFSTKKTAIFDCILATPLRE